MNLSHALCRLSVLLVAAFATSSAHAKPCGGIALEAGTLTLGDNLPVDGVMTPAAEACIRAIAAEFMQRDDIRSITVAARFPEGERRDNSALLRARDIADRLIASGVPTSRVSAVAPRTRANETAKIHFAYVQRRTTRPVGMIVGLAGDASLGDEVGSLTPTTQGALITPQQFLSTSPGSLVDVKLLDGSQVRIDSDSIIRFGRVKFNERLERSVQLELMKGNAEILASRARGPFELATPSAIAGVRGTRFRIAIVDKTTRVETLGGGVQLSADGKGVNVNGGKGSRTLTGGAAPETPRDLLKAPHLTWPLLGEVQPEAFQLKWREVGKAAQYKVQLARDTTFTKEARVVIVDINSLLLSHTELADGKWYWRVSAVDPDGFVGMGSKIYGFTLPAATQE